MGKSTDNWVEFQGHHFLLSQVAYIGPIFDYCLPGGKAQYFYVTLKQGTNFYLVPEHRDILLERWEEYLKYAQT